MAGWTIAEILKDSEQKLSGSDCPRLDAEVLLAHTLQYDRARLYAHSDDVLPAPAYDHFVARLNKRIDGQPVAYITGVREFWSLPLEVNQHTLIPRPETECLVEKALQLITDDTALNIADLGTGTGAIAVALARERPLCQIIATDIDDQVLATAERNVKTYSVTNIRLLRSDWFAQLDGYRFDFIISNPPYIEETDPHLITGDVRFEPRLALAAGCDGMIMLNRIIDDARSFLPDGGYLLVEHGFEQGDKVQARLQKRGYREMDKVSDLSGHHRGTLARWTD